MYTYRAFGLTIASDFPLAVLESSDGQRPDVHIRHADIPPFSGMPHPDHDIRFSIPGLARFLITGGHTINVHLEAGATLPLLSLYLLGSCMGAILCQRGGMLLHGSCVAKDGCALLITGPSGAGKSTLAREFLQSGWQLVTDDVAFIIEKDGLYYVQSSYPSQKLWQDAMERYALSGRPLYQENRMDKYHVNASSSFLEGLAPLRMILRLAAGAETSLLPIEGIARVDQLMKNTYRPYLIQPEHRERHFQRCVCLADEIPMMLGIRSDAADGARKLRDKIEEVFP